MELATEAKPKKKIKSVSYAKWGLIFIIPFFAAYLIFTFIPQLLTIIYSFFEYYNEGLETIGPKFCGFNNYILLFTPQSNGTISIIKYCGNTLLLWIIGAIPQFVIALLLAVIFTSTRLNIKGQRFFKTVFYLPNVIMASAFALLIWQLFENTGPINSSLSSLFGEDATYDFLANKISVRSLIALMNYIMWFGNTTIVLMAGIQGIDEGLFESARMDGAGSFQVFKDITMPLLKPIFTYVFITSLIGGLQMFDAPQILTDGQGTPDYSSTTIVMMLNRYMSGDRNFGMAGAVSVILFIFTAILSIFVFKGMAKDEK